MRQQRIRLIFATFMLLWAVLSLQITASPITRQQAQHKALAFMRERGKSIAMSSLKYVQMRSAQPDAVQPYYIFNIGNNQGYVIASGDDAAKAVLGFSDEGFIDINDLPCNMQAWLAEYARQIEYLQEHGAASYRAPKKITERPPIAPMLTTKWNQDYPYNVACPIDPVSSRRCLTGCVATAMSQVMYFHRARSVNQTTQEIPGYTTVTNKIVIDPIPAGSFIDWENMKRFYSYDGYDTDVQVEAVANLMKYCGVATEMDYTSDASSAYSGAVAIAWPKYFNYSSKTRIVYRDDSDEDWETLIYGELSHGRPVYYSGSRSGGGHAFVCDGYESNGFYHFNWGWGFGGVPSSPDGYFVLTANEFGDLLLPYSTHQAAIINAQPRSSLPGPDAGIHFADPEAKFLCLLNWDKNDDGALSLDEAAAVTDIGEVFRQSIITSFEELRYFTKVTTICGKAFYDCMSLTSVTLPASVTTIEDNSFAYSGLMSVTIPSSVTSIGSAAFVGCKNLKDLTWNAKKCESFSVPTTVEHLTIGDEVEMIPDYFASDCMGLTSVTIPSSVISIGDNSFRYTGLTGVILPNSVTTIGSGAFYGCSYLTDVTIPNSVTTIESNTFSYTGLTSLTIPSSVTTIGSEAFSGCDGLKSVTLPNTINSLREAAFSHCNGLTNVTINVDTVSRLAFGYCSSLKSVTLGNSVKSIANDAFCEDDNVQAVICLANTPPQLNGVGFAYDYNLKLFKASTLRVPIDALDAYKADEWWRKFPNIVGIDPSSGDVNLDDEVNVADINVIIDNILANSDDYMSDVNCDGEVNIADINALIDKILGHQ